MTTKHSIAVAEDGTVILTDDKGTATRYVKESDLLAVKGSKESTEKSFKAEKESAVETERQKVLQAEAKMVTLQEQLNSAVAGSAEAAKLKTELETTKKSGETLGNQYLALKREVIVATYGISKDTVEKKTMQELQVFEEALKAVKGTKNLGNFAAGGGAGGANSLQGKSPMELAQLAYSQSK